MCAYRITHISHLNFPFNKVHGASMEPIWVLSAPAGPHVGPTNLAIRVSFGSAWVQLSCNESSHLLNYTIPGGMHWLFMSYHPPLSSAICSINDECFRKYMAMLQVDLEDWSVICQTAAELIGWYSGTWWGETTGTSFQTIIELISSSGSEIRIFHEN